MANWWTKRVHCPKCGKYMVNIPGGQKYTPVEVALHIALHNLPYSQAWYFECWEGDACAWYLPPYMDKPELLIKRSFNVPLSKLF